MCKGKRVLMTDEIETFQKKNNFPSPVAHNPNKSFV